MRVGQNGCRLRDMAVSMIEGPLIGCPYNKSPILGIRVLIFVNSRM